MAEEDCEHVKEWVGRSSKEGEFHFQICPDCKGKICPKCYDSVHNGKCPARAN